jgi:hypothetical protein
VLCGLVETYRRFRGACCLHHQGDKYSSVTCYQTARRNLPQTAMFILAAVRTWNLNLDNIFSLHTHTHTHANMPLFLLTKDNLFLARRSTEFHVLWRASFDHFTPAVQELAYKIRTWLHAALQLLPTVVRTVPEATASSEHETKTHNCWLHCQLGKDAPL